MNMVEIQAFKFHCGVSMSPAFVPCLLCIGFAVKGQWDGSLQSQASVQLLYLPQWMPVTLPQHCLGLEAA